jgi:hypothetical protein
MSIKGQESIVENAVKLLQLKRLIILPLTVAIFGSFSSVSAHNCRNNLNPSASSNLELDASEIAARFPLYTALANGMVKTPASLLKSIAIEHRSSQDEVGREIEKILTRLNDPDQIAHIQRASLARTLKNLGVHHTDADPYETLSALSRFNLAAMTKIFDLPMGMDNRLSLESAARIIHARRTSGNITTNVLSATKITNLGFPMPGNSIHPFNRAIRSGDNVFFTMEFEDSAQGGEYGTFKFFLKKQYAQRGWVGPDDMEPSKLLTALEMVSPGTQQQVLTAYEMLTNRRGITLKGIDQFSLNLDQALLQEIWQPHLHNFSRLIFTYQDFLNLWEALLFKQESLVRETPEAWKKAAFPNIKDIKKIEPEQIREYFSHLSLNEKMSLAQVVFNIQIPWVLRVPGVTPHSQLHRTLDRKP